MQLNKKPLKLGPLFFCSWKLVFFHRCEFYPKTILIVNTAGKCIFQIPFVDAPLIHQPVLTDFFAIWM